MERFGSASESRLAVGESEVSGCVSSPLGKVASCICRSRKIREASRKCHCHVFHAAESMNGWPPRYSHTELETGGRRFPKVEMFQGCHELWSRGPIRPGYRTEILDEPIKDEILPHLDLRRGWCECVQARLSWACTVSRRGEHFRPSVAPERSAQARAQDMTCSAWLLL